MGNFNRIILGFVLGLIPFISKGQSDPDWPRFELYQLVQGQDSGIFVITDSDSNLIFTDLLKMRFFPDTALIFNGDTIAVKTDISFPTFVEGLGISIEYDEILNQYYIESLSIEDTIHNGTASLITKGTPLYAAGIQGNYWSVAPADASDANKMPVVIIAGEDINPGEDGLGLIKGHIKQVNTTGLASGSEVYVAAGGGYTSVKPKGENNIIQRLGTVIKGNTNNGSGIINLGDPQASGNLNPDKIFIGAADSSVTTINLYQTVKDTIAVLVMDSLVNYVSRIELSDSLLNYATKLELADTASAIRSSIGSYVTGTFINGAVPYAATSGSALTNSGWSVNAGKLMRGYGTPLFDLDVNGTIGATNITASNRINTDSILVTKGATFNTEQDAYDFRVDGDLLTGLILAKGSTNRVGIGGITPNYTLDVDGDVNISNGSVYRINGTALTGSQWTTTGSDIYYNSGNVGIGNTNPTSTLDVTGTANVSSDLVVDNFTFFVDASENSVGIGTNEPQWPLQVVGSASIDGSTFFVSSGNDRVGIGTGTPGYNLDVNGDVRVSGDFQVWTDVATPAFYVEDATGLVGIRNFSPSYELDVVGDAKVDSLFYNGLQQLSDEKIKTNIKTIKNQLENINKLNPVSFEFNNVIEKRKGQKGIGLIAQELEKIYPNLVSNTRENLKSVSYIDLIPYLIVAIQEQQIQIEELKQELKRIKKNKKIN